VKTWIGLSLGFVSALVVNWAYSREHDAAAKLPKLSPGQPIESGKILVRNRPWLIAFSAETLGWLVYVAALRLAPIALVQAVSASGIAVLAWLSVAGDPRRLGPRERFAVIAALVGLALLGLSLVGTTPSDHPPHVAGAVVWLAASAGGAAALILLHLRLARAVSLGLATGILFACGDILAKLVVYGGWWLLALVPLIASYGTGTSVLQSAFQHGSALTAAGIATMATNALPIAAGFVLFGQERPHGAAGVLQIAAFACVVGSATALGRPDADSASR